MTSCFLGWGFIHLHICPILPSSAGSFPSGTEMFTLCHRIMGLQWSLAGVSDFQLGHLCSRTTVNTLGTLGYELKTYCPRRMGVEVPEKKLHFMFSLLQRLLNGSEIQQLGEGWDVAGLEPHYKLPRARSAPSVTIFCCLCVWPNIGLWATYEQTPSFFYQPKN